MIFDLYGLKTQATSLDSERDQNFLCTTPDNKQMVLKISNPAENKTILEMQHECMKYIRANNAALQVPWMLVDDGENAIMEYDLQSTTYLVRLAHYLPGLLLTDVSQCGSMLHKLGAFLGHLSLAMRGFNHSAAHRDFPWDIAQTDFIETHKQYVNQHVETIDHFVELYKKIVLPNNTNLRKSVIHNDGNDHNVLANNDGEIVGIIDFGDMVYSFVACEPAVCMAYVALEKNDPLKSIAQVLKGFHEIFPLVDDELRSIIYLICIRCCITVTMASYRKLLFPDNEYISVTENQAWDFLKTMQNENMETCSRQLLTYAKS
jgi:Ser/Thr protein kinase RdoA (MazF antagonist)